jgi:hypothetical protein
VQSASGAIRYSAEPVDGVLGGGIEFIGHGKQAGEEANAAFGDALALGADDAADGSVQNIRLAARGTYGPGKIGCWASQRRAMGCDRSDGGDRACSGWACL